VSTIRVSDATAWEHCPRHAWFVLHPPVGEAIETDAFNELIKSLGEAHEADVLTGFETYVTAKSAEHTQELIERRTPVLYQPQFVDLDLNLVGVPDFLILEGDDYRVADAKLALSIDNKKAIKAQLGTYRRLANSALPARVFLGNGEIVDIDPAEDTLAETFVTEMQALRRSDEMPQTHYSYTKCSPCPFSDFCVPEFKAEGELTLNPAVQARAADGLRRAGVKTLAALANSDPKELPDVPYLKGHGRKQRAILQARSLQSGQVFRVDDLCLPPGDYIHFDVESDPMAHGGAGEVYLWGFLTPPHSSSAFEYVWKEREEVADKNAWHAFLELIDCFRERFETPYLVHYSNYERTQIRHYADRYGDQTNAVVKWLLAEDGPLLDLQKLVKDAFVLPVFSYGLKSICRDPRLVNFQWRLEESGSQWSVVRYYDYLDAESDAMAMEIKSEILIYNEDDVRATEALVTWLNNMVLDREGRSSPNS
jgi:predicted RecB family nuclease